MNKSEKTILEAIQNLQKHFDQSLADLKDEITRTKAVQQTQGQRIQNICARQDEHDLDIAEIRSILDDLVRSDALIRRSGSRAVLRKEPVYSRFGERGLTAHETLRLLEQQGYISRRRDKAARTKPVRLPNGGGVYRAIDINYRNGEIGVPDDNNLRH